MLKLDVEGAELDVLRGGEGVLAEALVLEVEVELNPLFAGQPLFADVDAHLRERGWALQGLRRTSWRRGPGLDAGRERRRRPDRRQPTRSTSAGSRAASSTSTGS